MHSGKVQSDHGRDAVSRPVHRTIARQIANVYPALSTLIESRLYWQWHHPIPPSDSAEAGHILRALQDPGYFVLEDYLSSAACERLISEIDRLFADHPEHVHSHSDERLFGVEALSDKFNVFAADPFIQKVSDGYIGRKTANAFTLAGRLRARSGSLGSGEGWHKDHQFRQFKAILYLTDVDEDNGPFQLVARSNELSHYLRDLKNGGLAFRAIQLHQEHEFIERLLREEAADVRTITGRRGTLILVDTACIHRGKPPVRGTRYSLTNYYFEQHQMDEAAIQRFKPADPERLRRMRSEIRGQDPDPAQLLRALGNSVKTFGFMLRRNSDRATTELPVRAKGMPLNAISPRRLAIVGLEYADTRSTDVRLAAYGNCYLDPSLLPPSPVFLSFGVDDDARFEQAVLTRHPMAKVVMVDPTPDGARSIHAQDLAGDVHLHEAKMVIDGGTIGVFANDIEPDMAVSSSASPHPRRSHHTGCKIASSNVRSLMADDRIRHIDVLKGNIEEAFLPFLESLLAENLFPTQVTGTFEAPGGVLPLLRHMRRARSVLKALSRAGYNLYRARPGEPESHVEFLAVRRRGLEDREAR